MARRLFNRACDTMLSLSPACHWRFRKTGEFHIPATGSVRQQVFHSTVIGIRTIIGSGGGRGSEVMSCGLFIVNNALLFVCDVRVSRVGFHVRCRTELQIKTSVALLFCCEIIISLKIIQNCACYIRHTALALLFCCEISLKIIQNCSCYIFMSNLYNYAHFQKSC